MNMNDIEAASVGEQEERQEENSADGLQLRSIPGSQAPDPNPLDVFPGWPCGIPAFSHHRDPVASADKFGGQSFAGLLVPTDHRSELGADHKHSERIDHRLYLPWRI
jgi:hypothetical protein